MSDNDPLDKEISFEGGARGKFYRPGSVIHLPIYLEQDLQKALTEIAMRKGIELNALVNELLKKDLADAEVSR